MVNRLNILTACALCRSWLLLLSSTLALPWSMGNLVLSRFHCCFHMDVRNSSLVFPLLFTNSLWLSWWPVVVLCSAFVEPGVIVMILIANGKPPLVIVTLCHLLIVLMTQQQKTATPCCDRNKDEQDGSLCTWNVVYIICFTCSLLVTLQLLSELWQRQMQRRLLKSWRHMRSDTQPPCYHSLLATLHC